MILEFTNEQAAQSCLSAVNSLAETYWTEQGYTVANGELIGKKNGIDNPNAARTLTWDIVKASPESTYYFTSLTGTPYEAGMVKLRAAFTFTEKDIPVEWLPSEE